MAKQDSIKKKATQKQPTLSRNNSEFDYDGGVNLSRSNSLVPLEIISNIFQNIMLDKSPQSENDYDIGLVRQSVAQIQQQNNQLKQFEDEIILKDILKFDQEAEQ